IEPWLAESVATTAGALTAITAPATKASKPLAAAVPIRTGRLTKVLTFCIVFDLLVDAASIGLQARPFIGELPHSSAGGRACLLHVEQSGQLGAVARTRPGQDVGHVAFDGLARQEEPARDLGVAVCGAEQRGTRLVGVLELL